MICRLKTSQKPFPASVVTQEYTPIQEMIEKLEKGQLSQDDIHYNPESTQYEDTTKVKEMNIGDDRTDVFEVSKVQRPIDAVEEPSQPSNEPSTEPASEPSSKE